MVNIESSVVFQCFPQHLFCRVASLVHSLMWDKECFDATVDHTQITPRLIGWGKHTVSGKIHLTRDLLRSRLPSPHNLP